MKINIYKHNKPPKTQTFARYFILAFAFFVVMGVGNVRGQVNMTRPKKSLQVNT